MEVREFLDVINHVCEYFDQLISNSLAIPKVLHFSVLLLVEGIVFKSVLKMQNIKNNQMGNHVVNWSYVLKLKQRASSSVFKRIFLFKMSRSKRICWTGKYLIRVKLKYIYWHSKFQMNCQLAKVVCDVSHSFNITAVNRLEF